MALSHGRGIRGVTAADTKELSLAYRGDGETVHEDKGNEDKGQYVGHFMMGQRNQDDALRDDAAAARDQDADLRDLAADLRDLSADRRDRVGDQRDEVADDRNDEAVQRDRAADVRERTADERDRFGDRRDRRDRAADRRDRSDAPETDVPGTASGTMSAMQRRQTGSHRRRALHDRQAAADERTPAELDRGRAPADRTVAAIGRDSLEADRRSALAVRPSSTRDRRYGVQLAASLRFGWTVQQLHPPEFLYVSPGYLKIMGLDPNRAGLTLAESLAMAHPDDRALLTAEYVNAPTAGQSSEAEVRIIRPDGAVCWIQTISNPVTDVDGTVGWVATTVDDITVRKAGEAALLASQQEAEEANAAKSEFLSRVSHELRTPLNAVLGFAQLLELETLTESQASAVGQILRGGRHLLEMINDVLDISRIESDQFELSIEPVSVADILSDTVGMVRPIATASLVALHCAATPPERRLYVLADRRRLRQVMLNLLSNAIKYNKPGGRVDVRATVVDHDHLQLSVTDTGMGIPTEDLPRLFIPFDRLGAESTDVEGTGIGLALSQRLVAIMRGRLEVESTVGMGSTFSVIMPLTDPPQLRAGGDQAEAHEALAPIRSSTLLYIEDNMPNVQLVQSILNRRPGWTLVHAQCGAVGLELAQTTHPALILLDLHLPDMHGIDVLNALRSDPQTADTPIVVVSADANPRQIQRLRAAGAQDYMTKPLKVSEVFRLLDMHGRPETPPA